MMHALLSSAALVGVAALRGPVPRMVPRMSAGTVTGPHMSAGTVEPPAPKGFVWSTVDNDLAGSVVPVKEEMPVVSAAAEVGCKAALKDGMESHEVSSPTVGVFIACLLGTIAYYAEFVNCCIATILGVSLRVLTWLTALPGPLAISGLLCTSWAVFGFATCSLLASQSAVLNAVDALGWTLRCAWRLAAISAVCTYTMPLGARLHTHTKAIASVFVDFGRGIVTYARGSVNL